MYVVKKKCTLNIKIQIGGKRKNRKRYGMLILVKKKAGVSMIISVTTFPEKSCIRDK